MKKFIENIRSANLSDISRIAEILVFSKRTHYRKIFRDDAFSFGVLQVVPTAREFLENSEKLLNYSVYDDGFVKGFIHLEGDEIAELYVDPFFENQHIGSALMFYALTRILHPLLWVVDGNENAIRFYQKWDFVFTGERRFVPGTDKYEALMRHQGNVGQVIGKTVRVIVDRSFGSHHPKFPDLVYPVNYGYVEGVFAGDGEEQDVYILGVSVPVSEFTGKIIAVIHRLNDNEDKWVTAPVGMRFSKEEIQKLTAFQEQFFSVEIII